MSTVVLQGINGRQPRTKRRVIKLRLKVSKDQQIGGPVGNGVMTPAILAAAAASCGGVLPLRLDVMSPPLSPTSLASAECIPHPPEYISISSSSKHQHASSSSSSRKRMSVRTFRKQFNLSTILEESEDVECQSNSAKSNPMLTSGEKEEKLAGALGSSATCASHLDECCAAERSRA